MKKKSSHAIALTIMKISLLHLFLTLFMFCANAHHTDGQEIMDTRIRIKAKNQDMAVVLSQIESKAKVKFIYSPELIHSSRKVSLNAVDKRLSEVLTELLEPFRIHFELKNGYIVLSRNKDASPSVDLVNASVATVTDNHQFRIVTGTVSDNSGEPLSGVSILVKGKSGGVVSDEKGFFSIDVPDDDAILVISYTGYKVVELPVLKQENISVILETELRKMDEVVVVGYGTQSKRNITGSVSKVDMKQVENLPNTNVTQAIRGRVAGVQFIDNGRPGQNGTVLIRGTRSLNGGNDPLIIVDGIQFNSSLADINPNDIESMEILKDASSAAIYGARAANGVILINSKKGKTEKPQIRFNTFYGLSNRSYKMKLLSPERYTQALLDWRSQSGLSSDPEQIENYLQPSESVNYKSGKTIDPLDEIAQQGSIGSYDVSISGKSKSTNYFLSGAYVKERGLIFNDNLDRISLRSNIETNIASWFKVGLNSTFIRRDYSGLEASLGNAYWTSPYGTLYYPDGSPTRFPVPEEQLVQNPMRAAILQKNEEIYHNLFTNFYTVISVPAIKGLSFRLNYSPNYRWRHTYNFFQQDPNLTNNTTSASKFNQENFDWVWENILTYNKKINENHAVDLTLLYGQTHTGFETTTASASPLANPANGWNSLNLGEIQTTTSSAQQTDGVSSMFRLNYRLKEKYLFTFTVRKDGSSVFATNNKYATFPSAAVAWIISDENFMQSASWVESLKLRLSYGSVGNQAIGPYQSLSLSSINQYVFGDGGTTTSGVFPSNMANENLKWETTTTSNIAVDFDLLKGRVGGVLEWYNMDTKDLIVRRSIPVMTGFTSVLTNLGATNNRGFEITLNTVNVLRKNFEWSSNIVFSQNKNKIVHLYYSDTDGDGKEDNDLGNRWFIGQPVNVAYDYVQDGVYQKGDNLPNGYKPGFIRLKDLTGDNVIDAKDRTIIGQLEPKYRWGLTNNFRYRNFSLSIFVNAMMGWTKSFNQLDFTGSSLGQNYPGRAVNMLDAGWWTEQNQSTTRPSLVYTNPFLHGYYVSRDFIRLQDVSLSYEFPSPMLKKIRLNNLRVYVSAKNLYTVTDWIGTDPESGYNTPGEYYPTPRTLTFGINTSF